MAADIMYAKTFVPDDRAGSRLWLDETVAYFRERGMTFFRYSHAPDVPDKLYVEGWYERPAEQGPHPWEPGQPQPAEIVNPARPA